MAQKNATPSKAQAEAIKRNKLNPALYVVVKELTHSMIIKHRITGEFIARVANVVKLRMKSMAQ